MKLDRTTLLFAIGIILAWVIVMLLPTAPAPERPARQSATPSGAVEVSPPPRPRTAPRPAPRRSDPCDAYFTDLGMFGGWHYCLDGGCTPLDRIFTRTFARELAADLDRIAVLDGADVPVRGLLPDC